MQIFFIKKKSTSYHDADDPRNGEEWEGLEEGYSPDPLISPPRREWEGIGRGIRY